MISSIPFSTTFFFCVIVIMFVFKQILRFELERILPCFVDGATTYYSLKSIYTECCIHTGWIARTPRRTKIKIQQKMQSFLQPTQDELRILQIIMVV